MKSCAWPNLCQTEGSSALRAGVCPVSREISPGDCEQEQEQNNVKRRRQRGMQTRRRRLRRNIKRRNARSTGGRKNYTFPPVGGPDASCQGMVRGAGVWHPGPALPQTCSGLQYCQILSMSSSTSQHHWIFLCSDFVPPSQYFGCCLQEQRHYPWICSGSL